MAIYANRQAVDVLVLRPLAYASGNQSFIPRYVHFAVGLAVAPCDVFNAYSAVDRHPTFGLYPALEKAFGALIVFMRIGYMPTEGLPIGVQRVKVILFYVCAVWCGMAR